MQEYCVHKGQERILGDQDQYEISFHPENPIEMGNVMTSSFNIQLQVETNYTQFKWDVKSTMFDLGLAKVVLDSEIIERGKLARVRSEWQVTPAFELLLESTSLLSIENY